MSDERSGRNDERSGRNDERSGRTEREERGKRRGHDHSSRSDKRSHRGSDDSSDIQQSIAKAALTYDTAALTQLAILLAPIVAPFVQPQAQPDDLTLRSLKVKSLTIMDSNTSEKKAAQLINKGGVLTLVAADGSEATISPTVLANAVAAVTAPAPAVVELQTATETAAEVAKVHEAAAKNKLVLEGEWQGCFEADDHVAGSLVLRRLCDTVYANVNQFTATVKVSGKPAAFSRELPEHWRPKSDVTTEILVTDNGTLKNGKIIVRTTGQVEIYEGVEQQGFTVNTIAGCETVRPFNYKLGEPAASDVKSLLPSAEVTLL